MSHFLPRLIFILSIFSYLQTDMSIKIYILIINVCECIGNSYQTVTIVPTSEVNQSGEVSYVLIVSQPDDEKNADMSVFDFKEEKGASAIGINFS